MMANNQIANLDGRGINLAHLNVASILGAHKFVMMQQQVLNSELHIFCASETWLTDEIPTGLVNIKGFNVARLDRGWKEKPEDKSVKKGGGLICYVKDNLTLQSPDQAAIKLQPALNLFTEWCKVNKLSLNVSKTMQINFGTRHKVKKASRTKLMMDNVALHIVPTYKYLGFMLDSTLSFNYHVKSVANILMYKSVLLAKIRKFLTEDVALRIYKSMILPYFDYGDVIYSSANQEGLEKLQRLQNKCLKICKGYNKRAGTDEIHIETKIPKLELRREAHINNFMYGRLENIDLVDTRKIRTRAHSAPLFKVKIPKLSAYKRSVEYAGATRWNNLPPDIRRLDNQDTFKAKQNQILLHSVTRQ